MRLLVLISLLDNRNHEYIQRRSHSQKEDVVQMAWQRYAYKFCCPGHKVGHIVHRGRKVVHNGKYSSI